MNPKEPQASYLVLTRYWQDDDVSYAFRVTSIRHQPGTSNYALIIEDKCCYSGKPYMELYDEDEAKRRLKRDSDVQRHGYLTGYMGLIVLDPKWTIAPIKSMVCVKHTNWMHELNPTHIRLEVEPLRDLPDENVFEIILDIESQLKALA